MNLPHVKVERCKCGDPVCSTYSLNFGMFYQGCGWNLDEASEIAIRLNSYEELVKRVQDAENSVYQKVADIIRERMDKRFDEFGTREHDTNACYFSNMAHQMLDDEDQAILDIVMDQKT